jgi:hypothetical protein
LVLVFQLFDARVELRELLRQPDLQELGQEPLRRAAEPRRVPELGGNLRVRCRPNKEGVTGLRFQERLEVCGGEGCALAVTTNGL